MKKTTVLMLFAAILLTAAACSKEKRIERRLHKGTGKWFVETYNEQNYTNGELTNSITKQEYGVFIFKKNSVVWKADWEQLFSGSWSNTTDVIMLTSPESVYTFDILEYDKEEMKLRSVMEITESSNVYKRVLTLELERD